MNPFFFSHGDAPFKAPNSAYARIDNVETDDENSVLFSFSAVGADWFDEFLGVSNYNFRKPGPEETWRQFWRDRFGISGPDTPAFAEADPFENMPLLQYEISISREHADIARYAKFAENESSWVQIFRDSSSNVEANVYGNLFGAPSIEYVSVESVSIETVSILNAAFDMDTWPDASEDEIENALRSNQYANYLAAFDVGQGSASALLDDQQIPWLYHDLGAGVYRNKNTTPMPLKFCLSYSPTIVLSHWDSDHWAGAQHDTNALATTWIAPRQSIGPTHTAFANNILSSGGTLLIWPAGQAPISVALSPGQTLNVGRATGNDRNGSCLVLRMDDNKSGEILHWLLTGDAGYHQMPFSIPGNIAAMTVPHHGAKMAGAGSVPARLATGYARLLYSFGPGNLHGGTNVQHPVQKSINDHDAQAWLTGTWLGAPDPGNTIATADVLATARHSSTNLGGLIAGWTSTPVPTPRPCGGSCTTDIKQA